METPRSIFNGDICRICWTPMEDPGSGRPRAHDLCIKAKKENWDWVKEKPDQRLLIRPYEERASNAAT